MIEAGAQGLLGEDLLAKALKVNDALLRTLEAEKSSISLSGDDPFTQSQVKNGGGGGACTGNLLDLDGSPTKENVASVSTVGKGSLHSKAFTTSSSGGIVGLVDDDDEDGFSGLTVKTTNVATPAIASVNDSLFVAATSSSLPPLEPFQPGSKAQTSNSDGFNFRHPKVAAIPPPPGATSSFLPPASSFAVDSLTVTPATPAPLAPPAPPAPLAVAETETAAVLGSDSVAAMLSSIDFNASPTTTVDPNPFPIDTPTSTVVPCPNTESNPTTNDDFDSFLASLANNSK